MVYRIRFAKYGFIKFIGHLDVMRYFQKVVRRSNLPVKYSQGFTPHQIMSFALPLGLGVTSDGEYMEVEFTDDSLSEQEIFDALKAHTTEGFDILGIRILPKPEPNTHQDKSMALVAGAAYLVSVKDGYGDIYGISKEQELWARFSDFMSGSEITVNKKTKKSEKEINLKDYIYEAAPTAERLLAHEKTIKNIKYQVCGRSLDEVDMVAHADKYQPGLTLAFTLAAGSAVNIKPELVMEAFLGFLGRDYNDNALQFHRLDLYMEEAGEGKVQKLVSMV